VRWSHRKDDAPMVAVAGGTDPELQARLDDELRDLD